MGNQTLRLIHGLEVNCRSLTFGLKNLTKCKESCYMVFYHSVVFFINFVKNNSAKEIRK